MNPAFWRDRRVLVTGHTGFKGGWLTLWLEGLGAQVTGYALPPPAGPSLYEGARIGARCRGELADLLDLARLRECVARARPEVVIHMAAQSLVRPSYAEPVATFATNVLGTAHLLDAVRTAGADTRAVVVVTSDKCYDNREWLWGYREHEPLGGRDPYSASKGCAEIVTASYRLSYFAAGTCAVASVRAGNVFGGGDWAADRLVPDLVRAWLGGQAASVRNPHAVRPWQHVLEPLHGYLALAQGLCEQGQALAEAWNFGPGPDAEQSVARVADTLAAAWGEGAAWRDLSEPGAPHEASFLRLDCSKVRARLRWSPCWTLGRGLEAAAQWYRAAGAGADQGRLIEEQIAAYMQERAR